MTSICVGCGMCCDGSMYRHVEVEPADPVGPLKAAGIELHTIDGATAFRQPCSSFGDGCCAIYENRPTVCREYRCLLLRRHEAGEVSLEDALALIARATGLRDEVRAGLATYLGPTQPSALEDLYRLLLAKLDAEPDPAAARAEHAGFLMSIAALRVILSREFEPRDSKSHRPADSTGGEPVTSP